MPYLDIVTNIIMFMLVTTTALAAVGVINAGAPKKCDDCAGQPGLNLSVLVTEQGFLVTAAGREIPGPAGAEGKGVTIPLAATDSVCRSSGRGEPAPCYDFDALTRLAAAVKGTHPDETKVSVAADQGAPFHVIVNTMDALRENRFERDDAGNPKPLFYDVVLAAKQ